MRTRYYFYLLFCILSFTGYSQQVIDHARVHIEDHSFSPRTPMYQAFDGKHYLHAVTGKNKEVFFNGEKYEGCCTDTIEEYRRRDLFMFQFDNGFNVTNSLIIDNARSASNIHELTRLEDMLAILLPLSSNEPNDTTYTMHLSTGHNFSVKDDIGKSMLLITDLDFNYIKHVFPTTGRIDKIYGSGEDIYMTISVDKDADFILLNQDTIHNYYTQFGNGDHLILAKYNVSTETFVWWHMPKNEFGWISDHDANIDDEGNYYQLIATEGGRIFFDGDTITSGDGASVIIKFNPAGELQWYQNFDSPETHLVLKRFYSFSLDAQHNSYVVGNYSAAMVNVIDTTLFSNAPVGATEGGSVLVQIDENGQFSWAKQIKGAVENPNFRDVISDEDGSIYVHGSFHEGVAIFNGVAYPGTGQTSKSNYFVLKVDPETGVDLGHMVMQGNLFFHNISSDDDKLFLGFGLRDDMTILGEEFKTTGERELYDVSVDELPSSLVDHKTENSTLAQVFPNPLARGGSIHVQFSEQVKQDCNWRLISADGFIVSGGVVPNDANEFEIMTHKMSAGQYILLIETKEQYSTHQLIID